MMEAGIVFLMPVYWGIPGDYQGWSFVGITLRESSGDGFWEIRTIKGQPAVVAIPELAIGKIALYK